jgi:hypothetical protein
MHWRWDGPNRNASRRGRSPRCEPTPTTIHPADTRTIAFVLRGRAASHDPAGDAGLSGRQRRRMPCHETSILREARLAAASGYKHRRHRFGQSSPSQQPGEATVKPGDVREQQRGSSVLANGGRGDRSCDRQATLSRRPIAPNFPSLSRLASVRSFRVGRTVSSGRSVCLLDGGGLTLF